jgi:hypothetical protein
MMGVPKCVRRNRKPDKEVTIDVIHAVYRVLESEWQNDKWAKRRELPKWDHG